MASLQELREFQRTRYTEEEVNDIYNHVLNKLNEDITNDIKLHKSCSRKYIFEEFTDRTVKLDFGLLLGDDSNYILGLHHFDMIKSNLEYRGFRVKYNIYPAKSSNTLLLNVLELTVLYTDTDTDDAFPVRNELSTFQTATAIILGSSFLIMVGVRIADLFK